VVPENDAVKINKNDCPQLDLFDWRPPAPTMATLERELRDARQDLHNLQVMQMKRARRSAWSFSGSSKCHAGRRRSCGGRRWRITPIAAKVTNGATYGSDVRRRRYTQRSLTLSIHDFAVAAASRAMLVIP
jgi:hypothetical protein